MNAERIAPESTSENTSTQTLGKGHMYVFGQHVILIKFLAHRVVGQYFSSFLHIFEFLCVFKYDFRVFFQQAVSEGEKFSLVLVVVVEI